jgi:XTP/dITP diphosphohydrolase
VAEQERGPPAVADLLEVIAALREHCPWTGALTHASLVEYLIEESYEVVEAIEDGHPDEDFRAELADILYQVVLHARIAQEEGRFGFGDVAATLRDKLIRRNPHVFRPDGSLRETFPATAAQIEAGWQAVKQREKPRASPFEGIPAALPALLLAAKSLDRADRAGVILPAVPAGAAPLDENDLGESLFAAVVAARAAGLDAERALRTAVARFQRAGQAPPATPGTRA